MKKTNPLIVGLLVAVTFVSSFVIADTKLGAGGGLTKAAADLLYVKGSNVAGKLLTVNNSLTLAGTDATTMTFPTTSASIARTDAAQTFTGIQTFAGDIQPSANNARAIGSSSLRMLNFYGFNLLGGLESGSNIAGTEVILGADQPTGNSAAVGVTIKAGTPQNSGSTAHPLVTIAQFKDCGSAATSKPCALFADGTNAQPSIAAATGSTTGFNFNGASGFAQFNSGGTASVSFVSTGISFPASTQKIIFNSAANDMQLTDEGFGILGLKAAGDNKVRAFSNNGAYTEHGVASELLTIAAAATTDTTANLLPANAAIDAVTVRVTTVIPTAATFSVGDATTAARFATGISTAATTTAVGLTHVDQTGAAGPRQTAAAKVRITPNATPGAATGVVRITVHYHLFVAPTS
jgi:hypothetical protein